MKNELQNERTANIKIIRRVSSQAYFCRDAVLFRITNGSGRLRCRWMEEEGRSAYKEYAHVYLDDELLFQMQVEKCPSYAGLVRSLNGNAIHNINRLQQEVQNINAPYVNVEEAVRRMPSLLGLLESGYYIAADYELFPVVRDAYGVRNDERDIYFWDRQNHSSWATQDHGWILGDPQKYTFPLFLLPSQRAEFFDPACAEAYRRRLQAEGSRFPRSIALYLHGGYALLLDGHHKAAASAAEGQRVKTTVLFRVDIPQPEEISGSKRLYLSNGMYGLFLCDGQQRQLGEIMTVKDNPVQVMTGEERYPAVPSAADWGRIPDAYRTRLNAYPKQYKLMLGTWYPQNVIRRYYDELKEEAQNFAVEGSFPEDKDRVMGFFHSYTDLFPDSKWLSKDEVEKLEKIMTDKRMYGKV